MVNHDCLRHYLKMISELLFLKYHTIRKPYIRQPMERASPVLQGEDSSGRGFSWGDNTSENGARKSFGGSVLKCQV